MSETPLEAAYMLPNGQPCACADCPESGVCASCGNRYWPEEDPS